MNMMDNQEFSRRANLGQKVGSLIEKVSRTNIEETTKSLLLEDLIFGKNVFCMLILKKSIDCPDSIPSLALLIASINSRIPDIGFVFLKRIVQEICSACEGRHIFELQILSQLLGCLVNHHVVYTLLAAQFLMVLLEKPYDEDLLEVAVTFLLDCGYTILVYSPSLLNSVLERVIEIYNLGDIKNISRQLMGSLIIITSDRFSGLEVQSPESIDQFTHVIPLNYRSDHDSLLDVLKANLALLNHNEKSLKSRLIWGREAVKRNQLCGWIEDSISMEESTGSCEGGGDDDEGGIDSYSCFITGADEQD